MRQAIFKTKSGGYTIIETMIATSLFIIVVMAGMGALLSANRVHQKSQAMRSIIDNLSFVMEDMSRNLRTGYNYRCLTGNDDLSDLITVQSGESCWGIAFESGEGDPNLTTDQWVYYLEGGRIYKSTQSAALGTVYQLTLEEVVIDDLSDFSVFSVLGAEPPTGDQQQPFVTIRLVGSITYQDVVTPFSLQTSASTRLIDI